MNKTSVKVEDGFDGIEGDPFCDFCETKYLLIPFLGGMNIHLPAILM